jgi:arginine decarboxylase
VQAFTTLAQDYRQKSLTLKKPMQDNIFSNLAYSVQISPREAFYALNETVPIAESCDRISAELICPYPPGIPVLMPGELITLQAIKYLQQIQATGGFISGCADTTLKTLKVVKS